MEIGALYDYDQDVIKSTVVTFATPQLEKILRLTTSLLSNRIPLLGIPPTLQQFFHPHPLSWGFW